MALTHLDSPIRTSQGAFIHPDDLELEEEYYDGEGEITYPGVIRPWEEALAIAQEEAEDERLYDEDGFKYPARTTTRPPGRRAPNAQPHSGGSPRAPAHLAEQRTGGAS